MQGQRRQTGQWSVPRDASAGDMTLRVDDVKTPAATTWPQSGLCRPAAVTPHPLPHSVPRRLPSPAIFAISRERPAGREGSDGGNLSADAICGIMMRCAAVGRSVGCEDLSTSGTLIVTATQHAGRPGAVTPARAIPVVVVVDLTSRPHPTEQLSIAPPLLLLLLLLLLLARPVSAQS